MITHTQNTTSWPYSEAQTRAFRIVHFIEAAKRCQRKAAEFHAEAEKYLALANKLAGGTASEPR